MYKIVNTITHEIFLGSEKAVLRFAQDTFNDEDQNWKDDHHWDLKRIGISDEVRTFQGAVKFLNLENFAVIDLGNILEELQNDEVVLLSQEEVD